MEQRNQKRTFPSKQCQIEGCEEISVGSKVPLCRKHRNKTYKQNYKKKKRNAEANNEENGNEIVIDDQYLLEQKYSNMLQDVLAQKQMELFESPSVVSLLKHYQNQKQMTRNMLKSNELHTINVKMVEKSDIEQVQQPKGVSTNNSNSENPKQPNEIALTSSLNYTQCYVDKWDHNECSMPSTMIQNHETSLLCPLDSSSIVQPPSGAPYVPVTSTAFQ